MHMPRRLQAQPALLASLALITVLFLGLNTFLALPPFVQREASLVFARDGTLLTRDACESEFRRTEIFLEGTAPTERCTVHRPAREWLFPWDWFRNR
ncbi:MAG: hypothetical protein DDT39_00488 [Firmicutes bacterium]|nr:hypothetical protein [candidate division NPL-UPA2 bacterium]